MDSIEEFSAASLISMMRDPKSRFIPQLLNYFKVSDFLSRYKGMESRDKIILPVSWLYQL
jgi:hypothetical protein